MNDTTMTEREAEVRDPRRNWGAQPGREPTLADGERVIHDEPGRVIGNTCYRSHYYRLTASVYEGAAPYFTTLRVHHGGGQESQRLAGFPVAALAAMDTDTRYLVLHALHKAHSEGKREAADATAARWSQAFVDGRIRRRKERGGASVRVWIEPAPAKREAAA